MIRVRPIDLLRWRRCLLLALCCSAYAVWASVAAAFPIEDDLAVARATLPADHPCRGYVEVRWQPGLRTADGHASAAAPVGHRTTAGWSERLVTGALAPIQCIVWIDPAQWAMMEPCQRRRTLLHEAGHLSGRDHSEGGIMDPSVEARDKIAVPGCPAILEALRDRITGAVLDRVPRGWEVSCGPRRGRVIRCTAEHGRHRRAYRARLHDQVGASFTVVRVKSQ
jgi:hypothetical protein